MSTPNAKARSGVLLTAWSDTHSADRVMHLARRICARVYCAAITAAAALDAPALAGARRARSGRLIRRLAPCARRATRPGAPVQAIRGGRRLGAAGLGGWRWAAVAARGGRRLSAAGFGSQGLVAAPAAHSGVCHMPLPHHTATADMHYTREARFTMPGRQSYYALPTLYWRGVCEAIGKGYIPQLTPQNPLLSG